MPMLDFVSNANITILIETPSYYVSHLIYNRLFEQIQFGRFIFVEKIV